jgi:prepilin-type N-terminal cleavage/methylation domain-containing protein
VTPARRGYTLTEMLIVVVVMSLLALFSLPRFQGLYERSRLASARQEIIAAIATARAAAIQKGRASRLTLNGNQLAVTVTSSSGTQTTIIPRMPLDSLYGISVSAPDSVLAFDVRGFVTTSIYGTGIFRLVGTSRRDSVCITATGQIMPRGCTL